VKLEPHENIAFITIETVEVVIKTIAKLTVKYVRERKSSCFPAVMYLRKLKILMGIWKFKGHIMPNSNYVFKWLTKYSDVLRGDLNNSKSIEKTLEHINIICSTT
jgi:hypothetical protein